MSRPPSPLKGLWMLVRDAPTGLPTILLGLGVLALGLVQGSTSAAAFLWPAVVACGAGVMLAIEYRASAAGSACALGAALAVVSEYFLFDILSPATTEFSLLALAVTTALLAAGPAWVMMLVAKGRQQGGDRYVIPLLPLMLLVVVWALLTRD